MTGKNQSYARCLNNRLVMRELLKENLSATMLSHRLNLSNAALSDIIDELKKRGYIRETDSESTCVTPGRRPVYYSVNENFGCIVVVGISDYKVKIVVSDMKKNITYSSETRVERYDIATIYELVLSVKNVLALPQYRDIPLMGIELSVPGRVNKLTGELLLTSQFSADLFVENNAIANLFAKQFSAPVFMTNDINLAAIGEMHEGSLKDIENGVILHVDEGIGGALILGGSLHTGSKGFAGEFGLMHVEFEGKTELLDEVASLRALKNRVNTICGTKLHTAELVQLYEENEFVKRYVLSTAACIGKMLKDVVEILDVSAIVLSGRVTEFGAEYLDVIKKEVFGSIGGANVVPSSLGGNAPIIGAISKAIEALIDEIFH
ncbi:MAG: ROK family transcriptional regulator [Clostridia bacterium]|nr:ROK family transcriptional regulator [Clostridia bacterium]